MNRAASAAARRYAKALLAVAQPRGEDAALAAELRGAAVLLEGNEELRQVLTHPALAPEKKRRLVESVWTPRRGSELFRRLLALLAARDRLGQIGAIAAAYAAAWNDSRGVKTARAVSAVPLAAAQQEALAGALQKATGAAVELTAETDGALLGGVVVHMDGRTYDGSVRTRLRLLRERLATGTP